MNQSATGSELKLGLIPDITPLTDIQMRDTVIRIGGDGMYYLTGSMCPPSTKGPAIPSIKIVSHRGQPSRLPSGAKAGGLDGARPRCDKNS